MLPNDLDTEYAAADVARADAALPPRVVSHLRLLGREHEPQSDWQARVFREIDHAGHVRWREIARDIAWAVVAGVVLGMLVAAAIAWLGGWL